MDILFFFVAAIVFNLVMFLFAFRAKTDKLTDISYAATFIFLALYGLLSHTASAYSVLVASMVITWAVRLGTFLLVRIAHMGRDVRFDGIRESFVKFGKFWLGQGVSVPIILLPAAFLFAADHPTLSVLTYTGFAVWLIGLTIEATADLQKYRFNNNPANKGHWIESGIWRYSRHPNYLGEILIWIGLYVAVLPAISGWLRVVGLASPLYIASLLLFISGIPPLEKSADKRWGQDAAYQNYKRRTSLLLLWPPKKSR